MMGRRMWRLRTTTKAQHTCKKPTENHMTPTRTRKPTSPGEVLSEEFLKPAGITQTKFAQHLGCDVKTINRLVNGRTSLDARMAQLLAAALGTTPDFWVNPQKAVELYEAQHADLELPPLLPQFEGRAAAG